jgi:RNA polymerase sigma-70 factor (ECF subfamily)
MATSINYSLRHCPTCEPLRLGMSPIHSSMHFFSQSISFTNMLSGDQIMYLDSIRSLRISFLYYALLLQEVYFFPKNDPEIPNKYRAQCVIVVDNNEDSVNAQDLTAEIGELDLIALAQGGDRRAFGELVLRHREGVVNVAYRMCGDSYLAEDMAQEAFIRAWQKLPGYRPHSPFRNWMYRIVTNATLDALRCERETVDIDAYPLAGPGKGLEASIEARDRAELVQRAVLSLPPSSRGVLVLREYEGLSYKEISETLDIPIGTVMSRLSYARQRLSADLEPLIKEKDDE